MPDNNYFNQIYQAALQQNPEMLPPKGTYAMDEFKQGHFGMSAVAQLAFEGNLDAAKWLIDLGAHINYAAYGAAIGGYIDFAKELLKQGADIDWVAQGAALGGYFDFTKELLKQGADINWVVRNVAQNGHVEFTNELLKQDANINQAAQGAAQGGHFDFANKLIQRGADINQVAAGAAQGGHFEYADQLIQRGADISKATLAAAHSGHVELTNKLLKQGADVIDVARGAALGGHVRTEQRQLSFLSRFEHQTTRHQFVDRLSSLILNAIMIEPAILKRADQLARLIHHFAYPYSLALASTQSCTPQNSDDAAQTTPIKKTNTGALVMLAEAACFQNPYPLSKDEDANDIQITLLPELWHRIFEFVFECELSPNDVNQLGFLTGRLILLNQVTDPALKKEIQGRNNVSELCEFITANTSKDKNDDDAASTSIAPLQTIFSRWHERFKPAEDDAASASARVTPAQ